MKFTLPEFLIIVVGSVAAALAHRLPATLILAALTWVGLTMCERWQKKY